METKLDRLIGQKVYVICARFSYRGRLAEVDEGGMWLADPTAVQESGPSTNAAPIREDPLNHSIYLFYTAIESVSQPTFAFAPLPNESS